MGPARTDIHGIAVLGITTMSSCDQLVTGPTHQADGLLHLISTDVPALAGTRLSLLLTDQAIPRCEYLRRFAEGSDF